MFSIGGAVLLWIAICVSAVAFAMRRARAQLGPTLQSFDALHHDVGDAVERIGRDSGRARAGQRVLLRHGSSRAPR
jgi:hypothetical protein